MAPVAALREIRGGLLLVGRRPARPRRAGLVGEVVDEDADDAVMPLDAPLDRVIDIFALGRVFADQRDGRRGALERVVDQAVPMYPPGRPLARYRVALGFGS